VETTISQQELQEAITASIADPLIKEFTVSLQTGYILVSGMRLTFLNETLPQGRFSLFYGVWQRVRCDALAFQGIGISLLTNKQNIRQN
jgi:hypothetical protein